MAKKGCFFCVWHQVKTIAGFLSLCPRWHFCLSWKEEKRKQCLACKPCSMGWRWGDWYLQVLENAAGFTLLQEHGAVVNSAHRCYRVHPAPECLSWSGGRGRNHSTCSLFKRHLALLLFFFLKRKYRKKAESKYLISTASTMLLSL